MSYSVDGICREVFVYVKDEIYHKVSKDKLLFIKNYQGQEGYLRFTEELQKTKGMDYVFKLVTELLSKKEKEDLAWQKFQGTTTEYIELIAQILNEKGEIRAEYIGMDGYVKFAKEHYEGQMQKAHMNISAILTKKQFQVLAWQAFRGTVREYIELIAKILNEKGEIRAEYIGMDGYVKFAKKHYNGHMKKAYINISAILTKKQLQILAWKQFQGTVREYIELIAKILNEKGEIRAEYMGMEGYIKFADEYYNGQMQKAYMNISAILTKKQLQVLGWQQFQGTTIEYGEIRDEILNKEGEIRAEYIGMEGYVKFAEEYYNGQMLKAYMNISAILTKKQLQVLGWQQFQGTVREYRELIAKILNEKGEIRAEYMGIKGYLKVAEEYYNGQMLKTYINISAILTKKQLQVSGWQAFQGAVREYIELIAKILNEKGE
ncbi:MAG: hypothetical protein OXC37_06270, partial [Bdellovibrionaceae bacterium]|nr:hypothetical protein [Pseudobdellovibrionaceae bacterium]